MATETGSDINGAPVRTNGGQFVRGHKGIGGRPRGSRSKLSEAFLADLHRQWLKSGKSVLAKVAQEAPETFLKTIAAVMPRLVSLEADLTVTNKLAVEIRDFRDAWEQWGKFIGAAPLVEIEAPAEDMIEGENDE